MHSFSGIPFNFLNWIRLASGLLWNFNTTRKHWLPQTDKCAKYKARTENVIADSRQQLVVEKSSVVNSRSVSGERSWILLGSWILASFLERSTSFFINCSGLIFFEMFYMFQLIFYVLVYKIICLNCFYLCFNFLCRVATRCSLSSAAQQEVPWLRGQKKPPGPLPWETLGNAAWTSMCKANCALRLGSP